MAQCFIYSCSVLTPAVYFSATYDHTAGRHSVYIPIFAASYSVTREITP
ncbi:MAG: hypothetical protein O7G88_06585 [bacterium]|nr:hypothetical protein [bacterium]